MTTNIRECQQAVVDQLQAANPSPDKSGDLFEALKWRQELKNDAALARFLDTAPPVISKIRHGALAVGASMILKIHELTGMPVAEIRALIKRDQVEV